jgi:hypothetical protein
MSNPFKAFAFDLDQPSFASLGEALPKCEIEVVGGASLYPEWKPQVADLVLRGGSARRISHEYSCCRG